MKLFHAPTSPYVRKVVVVAHELGLADRLEFAATAAHPVNTDMSIVGDNPLGKVPTLVTDDGRALFDSRVICEYLDALAGGDRMFPAGGARWTALVRQAAGDGLLDAALLARYEQAARPAEFLWPAWVDGQMRKIERTLAHMETEAAALASVLDIGTITYACALGYLDLRFPAIGWRDRYPALAAWYAGFSERPSMQATRPPAS
jgi:glutathione S-transferase